MTRVPRALSRRDARSLLAVARRDADRLKDPSKQIEGAIARTTGNRIESAIASVCEWYDRQGEALIEKVNLPTSGWGDSLRIAGASTVDYTGTVRYPHASPRGASCRGVAFDMKSWDAASFSIAQVKEKERQRFQRQIAYLLDARRRHSYATALVLYDTSTSTLSVLHDLEAVVGGLTVPVRTKPRPTKAEPTPAPIYHLPHIVAPLERAHVPQMDTRRPLLDFLPLLLGQ